MPIMFTVVVKPGILWIFVHVCVSNKCNVSFLTTPFNLREKSTSSAILLLCLLSVETQMDLHCPSVIGFGLLVLVLPESSF